MEKVGLKFRQLKYRLKHDYFSVENIVLIVAIGVCLGWAYQSIVSIEKSWKLTEELTVKRKELKLLEVEVETAKLENEYYASEEYQELLARKLANKQLAGEKMVYLPENSEMAKNKHQETKQKPEKTEYSNFEKWLMYLFPNK